MVFFKNCELECFEYKETEDINSYDEPKKEYVYSSTVAADFQHIGASESNVEYGEVHTDSYKAFVPLSANINSSMILRVKGQVDTYEIIGEITKNTHFTVTQHQKIILQKTRKPVKVQGGPQ